ncbi:MAG: phage tail length tape measure family protein [Gammaproteobacteria bacterium]|nr:phage tail length tape measure family protein [Gammaproteobacteria bacterium]
MANKKHTVTTIVKVRDEAAKKFHHIGNAAGGMGAALKKAALAAGVYFGARALKNFTQNNLRLFGEQELAERRLQQALKATGNAVGITKKELIEYARELQNVTTYGDETIIGGMALLATFKNIKKDVFKETTELALDMSQAMDQDLKSTIIQVGKALNDPAIGLTALSRVGVTFTEDQKKLIKQLIKTNDIMGAQKIILNELSSEFGGQARAAAEGYLGTIAQMKNVLGDVREIIGEKLAPAFKDLAINIKNWAIENRTPIGQWTERVVTAVTLAKDVMVAYAKYMREDWQSSFQVGLDMTLAGVKIWGRQLLVVFEKIFIDLENNVGVWLKRGITEKLDLRRYEKEFLRREVPESALPMEALKEQAKEYARGMVEYNRQYGIYATAFPKIETRTWGQVGEDMQNIAKDEFKKLAQKLPASMLGDLEEAWGKFLDRLAILNAPAGSTSPAKQPFSITGWLLSKAMGSGAGGEMFANILRGKGPNPLEARFLGTANADLRRETATERIAKSIYELIRIGNRQAALAEQQLRKMEFLNRGRQVEVTRFR